GGSLISTFFSGIVNESDLVKVGGYPGELRKLFGIWAEEIDALLPSQRNRMILSEGASGMKEEYECGLLCDLIHSEGAEVKAVYGDDFYKGMPALTVNKFGEGEAWYLATSPEQAFLKDWLAQLCVSHGIEPFIHSLPEGVETTIRYKDDQQYLFVLNHNDETVQIDLGETTGIDLLTDRSLDGGKHELSSHDVMIIKLKS